ncbi:Retinitis pigmentosa 9 [Branchiostoma belcheri]|nr:Retinitis pigmentosa 9 [Branchiostoma belcheri]
MTDGADFRTIIQSGRQLLCFLLLPKCLTERTSRAVSPDWEISRLIKENEEKPEDCIPDLPQNQGARDFLAHAPTKGLWMPLGKEVKVMKCWRCKNYGHRTGDRECPLFISGNTQIEQFRVLHEDPMYGYIKKIPVTMPAVMITLQEKRRRRNVNTAQVERTTQVRRTVEREGKATEKKTDMREAGKIGTWDLVLLAPRTDNTSAPVLKQQELLH